MEILNLSLPASSRFATDYTSHEPEVERFFHYRYHDASEYQRRLNELKGRKFYREELADYIGQYMSRFPSSDKTGISLDKLRSEDSVVIIGGQQAGILTGPLYTIHKVISIIVLAKQKEAELGVPVVPVFWIAGEDHDYHEVNHIFAENSGRIDKAVYPYKILEKKMVSMIELDRSLCFRWAESLIEGYGETEHTKDLLQFVQRAADESETFVDFFSYMIMELFKEYGILLADSGDSRLRKLEKDIFSEQLSQFSSITQAVKQQQKEVEAAGFKPAIEIGDNAANLFFYDELNSERVLLEYNEELSVFEGKNGAIQFSLDELTLIAKESPEKLSNNVVTRPITQERLFPVLAFIAGPGEIAYWAELKQAFEHLGMEMPPIVPRLNITLLERPVASDIQDLDLEIAAVLENGTGKEQEAFVDGVKDQALSSLFGETKKQLISQYKMIESRLRETDRGMLPLLEKNGSFLLKQLDFMEAKTEESLKNRHSAILSKYRRIEAALRPSGSPQERIWNILYYLNLHGLTLIDDIMELPFEFDGKHKLIKL
ncbi:bacillithiol biosynthesis cysteine-adding enzyme BshC [Bacillus infantis]|uniref:bacillithiol biosynthesis cysteine-adding enzyme BshC n=1 Tax=Bacillus infantis TaxID=324767 RepID=UPI003CF1052A